MSLTTITQTHLKPISTFTLTSNGVVQTGTLASVSRTVLTGIPTTLTTIGLDTILFTTTINGSPFTGASSITDTRTQLGTALPIRARSVPTQSLIVTERTNVTITTSVTVATVEETATQTQLTSASAISRSSSIPAPSTTTSQSRQTLTSSAETASEVLPSVSTSIMASSPTNTRVSTKSSSSPSETTTIMNMSTYTPTKTRTSGTPSVKSTSSSRVLTTLVTSTKSSSALSSPTATSIPAMTPMDMHTWWWVTIPAILGPLAIIALLWLWRKCARKSFSKAGCFFHATFETIGGIIFGKRWDKWKATRDENRRKKAELRSMLSPIEDRRVRDVLMSRWNDAVERHRRQGTMPEHNSPPSTASGGTWRNLDTNTLLTRPEPLEMTDRGVPSPSARPGNNTPSNPTECRAKETGRAVPSNESRSSGAIPDSPRSGAEWTEPASPLSRLNEARLNALAPWPEKWPVSPHPGVPWEPPDTQSLVSHNRWFPRENPPSEFRNLVHLEVAAKRASILRNIEGIEGDTRSKASFRGARGVWPKINPQPLPPPPKTPPLAAAVASPSARLPEPALPRDHPILSVPSPEALPGRGLNDSGLHTPPLQIRRRDDSRWTDASAPGTDYGLSVDGNQQEKSRTGAIASFLGWNTSSPIKNKHRQGALARLTRPPTPPSSLSLPPPIPANATRCTSISEWTDATIPTTTRPPTERATSRSPPLGIDRWNTAVTTKGLGTQPQGARRRAESAESVASWEDQGSTVGIDHRRSVSGSQAVFPSPSSQPRVPGFNAPRQSVTSAYSGYWADNAGGKIEYDRYGRIREVEFADGVRVGVGSSVGDGEGQGSLERRMGRGKERQGKGYVGGVRNDSDVDLDNKGYQRDERGNWI